MVKTKLNVLMMPDYRADNPYQSLLAEGLRSPSINIDFPRGYRRIFPLWRATQEHHINVLHLHWLTPYIKGDRWLTRFVYSLKLLIDLWLIRLRGSKIIWTIHNYLAHDCQFPKLELWLRKRLVNVVDEMIVHNYSTVVYLQQSWNIDRSKLTVIPHGHYRSIYSPAIEHAEARKKLNLPLNDYIYLNLGMIRPYKGIENLLQVWQENQAVFQSHTLLIVGQTLDIAYEKRISELTAQTTTQTNKVIFQPGFIPQAQMHLYFSAANVVVLPFTNILTSGSLILAMSYGKPIIAPRQGGIQETLKIVDDLLYDPSDREGLFKALKTSTQMDLATLDKLSDKVNSACDRLSWDAIAQQTAEMYQK